MGTPGRRPWGLAASGPPTLSAVCSALQVDGRRHPGLEEGIQVVVIDGSHGRVLSHASFRNAVLQGIPWQLFNHVAAIPDR